MACIITESVCDERSVLWDRKDWSDVTTKVGLAAGPHNCYWARTIYTAYVQKIIISKVEEKYTVYAYSVGLELSKLHFQLVVCHMRNYLVFSVSGSVSTLYCILTKACLISCILFRVLIKNVCEHVLTAHGTRGSENSLNDMPTGSSSSSKRTKS